MHPPLAPTTFPRVTTLHEPVYVAGRYLKYSRSLSQTPWLIDGVRKSEFSVEELLTDGLKAQFGAAAIKFSASGREDVDVRMLGTGRPFMVELQDPHIATLDRAGMEEIQAAVNGARHGGEQLVGIRDLQIVDKVDTETLKEGEETKTKTYSCVVWLENDPSDAKIEDLAAIKDLKLEQRTPIRVLHRRNLAMRPRLVHWIKARRLAPHFVKLWLNTQAGTYIKEFVHGDFGRTFPSLGTLIGDGGHADILSLDVVAVQLDWPPLLDGAAA